METILLLQVIILGAIEGFTEFIPVSSTAHLLLFSKLIDFVAVKKNIFEIVIQFGAILAVCVYYKKRIKSLVLNFHKEQEARNYVYKIILAFIPTACIGILCHDFIKSVLFSEYVIASMLIIGGLIIILVERSKIDAKYHCMNSVPMKTAFLIGCCQSLAMIPGTSRSGATIIGALLLGLNRRQATEFSFFLAIPTVLGASCYDLYKNIDYISIHESYIIALGFVSAFISALLVVSSVIKFIEINGFLTFAYYRIILGVIIFIVLFSN